MTATMNETVTERHPTFVAGLRDVEWRDSRNGTDFTFTGAAVVFNSWSEELWTPMGVFRERILPGAFTRVLAASPDVRLLINHDSNLVLARTRSGTLELTEEANALRVWARVAPTSYAKDLRMSMSRSDIDQMSFAFAMDLEKGAEDRWYEDEATGEIRRDVVTVSDLYDVSPVTYPAYPDTSAVMREVRAAADAGRIRRLAEEPRNDLVDFTVVTFAPDTPILTVLRDAVDAEFPNDDNVSEHSDSPIVARAETDPLVEPVPATAPEGVDGDKGDQDAQEAVPVSRLRQLQEDAQKALLDARAGHHRLLKQLKP